MLGGLGPEPLAGMDESAADPSGVLAVGEAGVAVLELDRNGLHSLGTHQGYEINLALAALTLTVVILGAGRYSVDASIERRLESA